MSLLEMKNISKEFPGVKALDNVSLTVRKREKSLVSSVLPARENQPFFDVQRGLRLRMQGKSIIPEPLDWCFRILICFRIIR